MNEYLKNLTKIEFVVTTACTGKCRHCQNGDVGEHTGPIDAGHAEKTIRMICEEYRIETVMTFGGEPLLYPDVVCAIHKTAADMGIARRQIITNGYFSKQHETIEEVVQKIADSGTNDVLLSADAFHQETIPLEPVVFFAECAVKRRLPIALQPAWLVSMEDDNPYNARTREVIRQFEYLQIPVGPGNVVFPSGNALKYLRDYFDDDVIASSPYDEDPRDRRTISVGADGSVLNGNI